MSLEYYRHTKLACPVRPETTRRMCGVRAQKWRQLNFESRASNPREDRSVHRPSAGSFMLCAIIMFFICASAQKLDSSSKELYDGEHSFISVRSLNFCPRAEDDYMSLRLIIDIAEANLDGWNIPDTAIVVPLPVDLTHQEKMNDMRQTSKLHRKAPVGHHHWRANDYMGSDG